ncbi:MAG: hypothetical protein HY270_21845 [Deltaproteobacteria bacterium]|nr:hypothetical protein [Deltaproteobacteria bacterium]
MPSARTPSAAAERYWETRVRSKAFRDGLTALLADQLRVLATTRFKDVVDSELVRRSIKAWDRHMLHADVVADVLAQLQRRGTDRLDRQRKTPRDLVGDPLGRHIEALLTQPAQPSKEIEAAIRSLVQQEFVTGLLTDLVFTSISTFYQRLNPFFGAFAMRTMEDQIKAFIHRFTPMLQERVTAFAISRENQQAAHELSRTVARQMLAQPLSNYAAMISSHQRQQIETIVREALRSPDVEALTRQVGLAVFNDLYAVVRNKKVGELLRLEHHENEFADLLVEALLPAIGQPLLLRFFAAEADLAQHSVADESEHEEPEHAATSAARRARRVGGSSRTKE